jgi:hypothetical protein
LRVPAKTHTELIRELTVTVTTLVERVNNARAEIVRVDSAHSRTAEALAGVSMQVAVLEERLAELKRALEERGRKQWLVAVAFVGCLLTFIGNLLISLLRK